MYAKLGYLKYKQEKKSAMQDQLAVSFASKSRCKLEMISFVEELTEVVVHANSCPKVCGQKNFPTAANLLLMSK